MTIQKSRNLFAKNAEKRRRRHIFLMVLTTFSKLAFDICFFLFSTVKADFLLYLEMFWYQKKRTPRLLFSLLFFLFFNSPSLTLKSVSVDDRNNKSVDVKLFFTICTHMKSRPTSEIHTCMNHP